MRIARIIVGCVLALLSGPVLGQCLNVNDFQCFVNRFAAGEASANCDGSTAAPVLNVNDFNCFLNRYAAGDPRADCDGSCGAWGPAWTDFPLPAGCFRFYVDPAGSDAADGLSPATAFGTVARGKAALRDGFADQLLLKAGRIDQPSTWFTEALGTWTKAASPSAGYGGAYMVVGAYAQSADAPRAILRTGGGAAVFGPGGNTRRGLALVGLDLAPLVPGADFGGVTFLESWGRLLIEDCSVTGYPTNIVVQETGPGRLPDVRVRYSIVADATNMGGGHSQGIFAGSVDGLQVHGCVIDNNARRQADMFCHNVYAYQNCGPWDFSYNITSRACSHGVQQRSGGVMSHNLGIGSPINFFQGDAAGVPNTFSYNTAIDSRDINSVDTRGYAFWLNGSGGSTIEYNVAGHQRSGTANVTAFQLEGVFKGRVRNNGVLNWTLPGTFWGTAFFWEGGTTLSEVSFNRAWQREGGLLLRGVPAGAAGLLGNIYSSTTAAPFWEETGLQKTWAQWSPRETGSALADPGPIDVSVAAYMSWIGLGGDVPEYLARARQQARYRWDARFTAEAYGAWARARMGL